jgi:transcriptional antiterminator RfaH
MTTPPETPVQSAAEPSYYQDSSALGWHCVQTKPKSEHFAAAHLKNSGEEEIEVFCPRIRYKKNTRRGKVWFNEALFPCYLFVRFRPVVHHRTVLYAHAVNKIVRFGERIPVIGDEVIAALRKEMGGDEIRELPPEVEQGDHVILGEGPLAGLTGVVHLILTGEERVRILFEFLGRQTFVEAGLDAISLADDPRHHLDRER